MTNEQAVLAGRRASFLAKIRNIAASQPGSDPTRRVQVVVAIDRFLVRLLATAPKSSWILKGGYANQLRFHELARFTEDVDVGIDADIEAAKGMIADAAGGSAPDAFSFEVIGATRELTGPPGGGLRFLMSARVYGTELVRFKVDVSSQDVIVGRPETHPSDPIIALLGLKPARFPTYPMAQQFAEKLHAYTLPREQENTRARDLADIVWMTRQRPFTSRGLIDAGMATFTRRGSHPWPPHPALPPVAWTRQWDALRREMDLPATAADGYSDLVAFLEPVVAGERRRTWSPKSRAWSRPAQESHQ